MFCVSVTNEEAAAQLILTTRVGTLTQNIYVQNTTQLTAISINLVKDANRIYIARNVALTDVIVNSVMNNKLGELEVETYNGVNTPLCRFEMNKINQVNQIFFTGNFSEILCNNLETIVFSLYINLGANIFSFPDLKYIGTQEFVSINGDISNIWFAYINEVNFPKLEEVSRLDISGFYTNGILSFPSLKKIKKDLFSEYYGFVSHLDLPKLEYVKIIRIRPLMHDLNPIISMPSLKYCESFSIGTTGLSVNKVNAFYHQFLTVLPATGKQIDLSEEVQPTGQGLLDKQILINQGNIVY